MTNTSRRDFFKLAGATAAGAAVFGLAGCSPAGSGKDDAVEEGASEVLAGREGEAVNFTSEVDVLIIGAGPGGLMCAYETGKAGLSTLVVDKLAMIGGCGATSGGTHNSSGSRYGHEKRGAALIESIDQMPESSIAFAEKKKHPDFAKQMLLYSAKAIDVLAYDMGVEFREEGFDNPSLINMYIPKEGIGQMGQEFGAIKKAVEAQGVQFLMEHKCTNLIVDGNGEVAGVRLSDLSLGGKTVDIKAANVVIATGSFASNQEMVAEYVPEYTYLGCKTVISMGEGITLGKSVGGVVDSPNVPNLTSHSTCVYVAQRFGRSISVLPNGKRFYDETSTHGAGKGCIGAGCGNWWSIWDDEIENGPNAKQVATAGDAKITANSIEELAELTTVPYAELKATFDKYDAICDAGVDDEFGRKSHLQKLVPPYYAFNNHPMRYKTRGGMLVDLNSQMLDANGNPIPHMFAAGIMGLMDYSADLVPAFASGLYCGEKLAALATAAE